MKQVLCILALLATAVALWLRLGDPAIGAPTGPQSLRESQLPPNVVVISMLYSPAKQAWIEWARDQYVGENPHVQVKLTPMASILSIDAILLGREKPVVWSPESMLELGDVVERWQKQTGRSLYGSDPEFAPESLLRTALVLIAWESRAKVIDEYLRRHAGKSPKLWERLIEATASREGWKALGGPAEWGAVKFAYADPLQTGTGLWTMYLACLDELGDPLRLAPEKLDDPRVVGLLRSAAASPLTHVATAGEMVTRMEQFGPSRYDLAVTYETLALAALETPKERWERLVIVYPHRSVWSNHPAVVLELDELSDEQRQAGLQWIHYLRSPAAQREAIRYGFRPGDESIPLYANPQGNPFVVNSVKMGERLESETAIAPPQGDVVEKLLTALRNAFGRHD